MARNVYAMSIHARAMEVPYRALSLSAPEFHFDADSRLRRIDWQPAEGEDLTVEFLADLVSGGEVQHVRVYRAQMNRGGREGPFAGRGGRRLVVSREPVRTVRGEREDSWGQLEEPWR